MRNMLSAAMWNLHGKVCEKPCRNVEKRVLHRWNLVELPLQAAVSSYLSEKENAMRVIRRSPERKALVLHQRSAQLSPNSRKPNRKKPSAPQNRPRSERIEPTPRQQEDRPTVKDKPQTVVADYKAGPSGRTSDGAGQAENTIYNAQRTGRRNLWCGVQTAENRKNHAQTAVFRRAEVSASDEKRRQWQVPWASDC